MGAAASIQLAYKDAIIWFREYFDCDLYLADFEAIDKDHDGAIRLIEVEKWLAEKNANEGGPWKHFMNNPEIIQLAHNYSSKFIKNKFLVKKKIVDIAEFRTLLVHLFVISILWVHFKRADEYQECGDAFNNLLSLLEFKLAVKTFCAAYSHEELTDEQIIEDFNLLHDEARHGVTFAEVCNFCYKFIDPKFAERVKQEFATHTLTKESVAVPINPVPSLIDRVLEISNSFTVTENVPPIEVLKELKSQPTSEELEHIIRVNREDFPDPTTAAMESVVEEINKHIQIVQLTELKFTTELSLQQQGIVSSSIPSSARGPLSSRLGTSASPRLTDVLPTIASSTSLMDDDGVYERGIHITA